jgi:hypothetical protein
MNLFEPELPETAPNGSRPLKVATYERYARARARMFRPTEGRRFARRAH